MTKQGQSPTLVVDKQGGKVAVKWPDVRDPWLAAYLLDKNHNPTGEELRVASSEIVSIQLTTDKPATKKRSAT